MELQPGDKEYEDIKRSIQRFGFADPLVVNADMTIIGGHQRLNVAKDLGYTEVPCAVVDLSKAEEQALNVALNKMGGRFDNTKLANLLKGLSLGGFDTTLTGYTVKEKDELINGLTLGMPSEGFEEYEEHEEYEGEETDEYKAFVDKFKIKKTTDDCYTPQIVYDAVKQWAVNEYGLGGAKIVRPFYPGADYTKEDYNGDIVVIDNPPFSIISEICRFYITNGVRFFLFAPALTLFSTCAGGANYLPCGADVEYENGAKISTSFITNLGTWKIDTAPRLYEAVKSAVSRVKAENAPAELPIYVYPEEVITAPAIMKYAQKGADIKIKHAAFVRLLDCQRDFGKTIFGGGFLISKAAAEKAAAEKERQYWELSEREQGIIQELGEMDYVEGVVANG